MFKTFDKIIHNFTKIFSSNSSQLKSAASNERTRKKKGTGFVSHKLSSLPGQALTHVVFFLPPDVIEKLNGS